MSLKPSLIIVALLALPFIAWFIKHEIHHWKFKRAIYARPDSTLSWQSRFPDAMPVVDRVLRIFCDAFLLDVRHRYQLRTDDRVVDIYTNTTGPAIDEMQMENLGLTISSQFGVNLIKHFNQELTLADLVDMVLTDRPSSESRES